MHVINLDCATFVSMCWLEVFMKIWGGGLKVLDPRHIHLDHKFSMTHINCFHTN